MPPLSYCDPCNNEKGRVFCCCCCWWHQTLQILLLLIILRKYNFIMNHMIQVWQFDQVDDPYSRQCVIMMFIYYIYYCAPVWPNSCRATLLGKLWVPKGSHVKTHYSSCHLLPLIFFRLLISPPVLRSACRLNTWPSDRHSTGPQVSGRYGRVIHTHGNKSLRCLLIVETLKR